MWELYFNSASSHTVISFHLWSQWLLLLIFCVFLFIDDRIWENSPAATTAFRNKVNHLLSWWFVHVVHVHTVADVSYDNWCFLWNWTIQQHKPLYHTETMFFGELCGRKYSDNVFNPVILSSHATRGIQKVLQLNMMHKWHEQNFYVIIQHNHP